MEYAALLAAGVTPATAPFLGGYFLLTGVHLAHVLGGLTALTIAWRVRPRRSVLESVASFWHLVDLLWLMIFPLLYLQR